MLTLTRAAIFVYSEVVCLSSLNSISGTLHYEMLNFLLDAVIEIGVTVKNIRYFPKNTKINCGFFLIQIVDFVYNPFNRLIFFAYLVLIASASLF